MPTNCLKVTRLTYVWLIAVAICLICLGGEARAVTTSGSTYAKKTGGASPLTDSDSHSMTHPTNASSSSVSNAASPSLNSHAQSWATAKLVGSPAVLTKTASGKTWIEAGADTKATSWYSYSSGTLLQVNSAVAQPVQMRLIIRDTNDPLLFDSASDPLDKRPDITNPLLPSVPETTSAASDLIVPNAHQSLYVDSVGALPGDPNPSFFDIFVDLQSSFSQFGSPPTPLLNGTANVNHLPATSNVDFAQNFVDTNGLPVTVFHPRGAINEGGLQRHAFDVDANGGGAGTDDVIIPFTVQTNAPFDVLTNLFITMGYPDGLADPFSPINPALVGEVDFSNGGTFVLPRPAGGAGSLIVQIEIDPDQVDFELFGELMIVPEPSSAILSLISIAGLMAFRRKRSLRT